MVVVKVLDSRFMNLQQIQVIFLLHRVPDSPLSTEDMTRKGYDKKRDKKNPCSHEAYI